MSEPMIALNGISKSYTIAERAPGIGAAAKALFFRKHKTVEALRDISFSIREGEIAGYIGPNGAGKSTTIKTMCGILVPDGGSCRVMGYTPWQNRTEYVRHIGVVFGQRSQLWWDVPVLDSYELLRDIYKVPAPVYRRNLDRLSGALDLGELLHTPVRQLSLGQRMRCELAASLLHEPRVLFLDEPTIGLDAASKLAVRDFIRTLNRESGVTVILTTHDMNDIEALAERILMIGKGSLLYDGSLSELRRRFGGGRTVTLDFAHCPERFDLPGAVCLAWTPQRAAFRFDGDKLNLAGALSAIPDGVEVTDVDIAIKSADELILELYGEHRL